MSDSPFDSQHQPPLPGYGSPGRHAGEAPSHECDFGSPDERIENDTQWAALLNAELQEPFADGDAFTRGVVRRWETQPATDRWRMRRIAIGFAAAAVATFAFILPALLMPEPKEQPPTTAQEPDPVGVLVAEMDRQIEQQPRRWLWTIDQTAALLDVRQVAGLVEIPGMEMLERFETTRSGPKG